MEQLAWLVFKTYQNAYEINVFMLHKILQNQCQRHILGHIFVSLSTIWSSINVQAQATPRKLGAPSGVHSWYQVD